ncbi:FAD-dependent monooxygenase [Nocardia takedensis]
MATTDLHILVSGGGIAGNAVALQLIRAGFRVTVVERAVGPRPGGQAVDLRGPSREVAERMGLLPGIRARQLDERGMAYVDRDGREYARMPTAIFEGKGPVADIEITRGDLAEVLLAALAEAGGDLDYRYGDHIEALDQDAAGVEVAFASGRRERFDLVIGADGVHSATRRLAFGPEERFSTYLGGYTSYFTMPAPADIEPGWMTMHSLPGVTIGLRPDADPGTCKAFVVLRVPADPALRRDVAAQQALLRAELADAGWRAPEILAALPDAADFYFDELARIDVPELAAGRVTLVGDAGYCGSPLSGMGTAMALVGAYLLAGALTADPNDLVGAVRRYARDITPFLDQAKKLPGGGIAMMVPASGFGVRMAKVMARAMVSKPMRPLVIKMMSHTDDFELPTYPTAATPPA